MFLTLMALTACAPETAEDSAPVVTPDPSDSPTVAYYVWEYDCSERERELFVMPDVEPLWATWTWIDTEDDVWHVATDGFSWRATGESDTFTQHCEIYPAVMGKVVIAYLVE